MPRFDSGIEIWIKNISASPVTLPEIGGYVLQPDAEVDIMDCSVDARYSDESAALRAMHELTGTVLYQGIHGAMPTLSYRVTERV